MASQEDLDTQAKLRKYLEQYDALRYQHELRLKRVAEYENCLLILGSSLLRLKHDYGYSWEQMALLIDGISDRAHAYRIARREKGISSTGYKLAIASINNILFIKGEPPIDFPPYPASFR